MTKARSHDGARLDLRVHRLAPGASTEQLRFEALTPGARYRLSGPGVAETLDAGPDGAATVVVQIEGRLDLAPGAGGVAVILNIDKSWTRLVALKAKVLRRPQVSRDRPPVVVRRPAERPGSPSTTVPP